MNLWVRLIFYALTNWRRPPLAHPLDASVLRFLVWPLDLDIFGHVNNGRYLALMDFGRLDLMVRSGIWKAMRAARWTPTVTNITVRYRRELRLGTRIRLETRIVGWDATSMQMEHAIVIDRGPRAGELACLAIATTGIYDRAARRMVAIEELIRIVGVDVDHPPRNEALETIAAGANALRDHARARQDEIRPASGQRGDT